MAVLIGGVACGGIKKGIMRLDEHDAFSSGLKRYGLRTFLASGPRVLSSISKVTWSPSLRVL